jgi:cytochrome c
MNRQQAFTTRSAAETACKAAAGRPGAPLVGGDAFCWFRVLVFLATIVLFALTAALNARAAEADQGKRLAQDHCASCHIVAPQARGEVAVAPPFDVIGRKYGFDADKIARAIAGPHPKMNFSPRPAEAADIAAYIATLSR